MAVVVVPLSVTYPSDCISWWGHPGGCRGGLTGLWFSTCGRYSPLQTKENINQAQDTQEVVWIETPLHPRMYNMLEAMSQQAEGSGSLGDEDVLEGPTSDITVALEQFFTSCGVSC